MRQAIIGLGIVVALTLGVMTAAAQVAQQATPQHIVSADTPVTLGLVWVIVGTACRCAASICQFAA